MAVTFISNGYDTTSTNPYTETAWAEAHPSIGLARYGVRSPLDWKVSAVAGLDRTVSINPGRAYGHGVTDKTVDNETIPLDAIASGSRWDLIVCRRDWTPTAGESKFVKINGGSTAVIPGGRLVGPGNIDDQPIALVQVTAGQTQPTAIIDLRTWSGDGGGFIAADDLVRSFMNTVGTRLYVQSTGQDWVRKVGANDTPAWVEVNEPTVYAPVSSTGWTVTGDITTEPAGSKRRVTVNVSVKRTGAAFTLGYDAWEFLMALIPEAVRSTVPPVQYVPIIITGGGNHINAAASVNPNGSLTIRSVTAGSYGFTTNALFTINLTYFI